VALLIPISAFGCGAYGNPPLSIAKLFHKALHTAPFRNSFKHVVFAIYGKAKYEGWIDSLR
jgi:uncharacterized protein (TIGR02452 family)